MKEKITDISNFLGLYVHRDPTKSPPGSAREMVNLILSDRGGIKKRPGVELLGSFNTASSRCNGFAVFRKTDSITEIPIKAYSTVLEYYHPTLLDWQTLQTGYDDGKNFGFVHGFIRSGNDDHIYFNNRFAPDSRWNGALSQLDGALAGGETEVQVDSVLRDDIYYSGTASSASATTIDISASSWASSQWINFYVYIKTGTHAGKIRQITANTSSQITFDTLGTTPGTCDFEIRYALFPASGTIIVGGTSVAYTALPEYNKFTVSSAPVAADDAAVALVPDEYPGNPRGNRLAVLNARRYVANVRSGMLRDSAGTLSGAAQPGSVFVSKVVNALFPTNDIVDFSISATRAAGEGDIISGAYGGEGHTDIVVHEDEVFMFKPKAIEAVKYTQDTSDLAQIRPVSTSYGSIMRVIEGTDDVYFVTSDKQFTSLGRVQNKDSREQALNIGLPVKRLLESYGYDPNAKGAFFKNRIHLPVKYAEGDDETNRLLLYNLDGRFEGEWWLPVDAMDIYYNKLYASLSNNPNVIQLYKGLNDVLGKSGDNEYSFPITSRYRENWLNLTKSGFNQQEVNLFACEGYILGGTTLTFKLYKDFETEPFLEFEFAGTEDQVDDNFISHFLGSLPAGIEPLGAITSDTEYEGMKHFMFILYFPFVSAEWLSWGFTNSGKDQNFDILRAGMNLKEEEILDFASRIKSLT